MLVLKLRNRPGNASENGASFDARPTKRLEPERPETWVTDRTGHIRMTLQTPSPLKRSRPLCVDVLKRALHAPDFRGPRPDRRSDVTPSGHRPANLGDDLPG
jgi:hypothetical protein